MTTGTAIPRIRLSPVRDDDAVRWFHDGNAHKDAGRLDDAIAAFERALQLRPHFAEVHFNLANTLTTLGRPNEAEHHYREAVRIAPSFTQAGNNLGTLLQGRGRQEEARQVLESVVRQQPHNVYALNNLGNVLRELDEIEESIPLYRRAIFVARSSAESHDHLAAALRDQGRLDEAEAVCRTAVALNAGNAKTWNNLGNILFDRCEFDDAIVCYGRAIELDSRFAQPQCNRALVRLVTGDFRNGWQDYEARWELPNHRLPAFTQPRWDGSDLRGRTILLDWEQGLGDTLQFIRYARCVKERGGTVIVRCQRPLVKLLQRTPGIDAVIPDGDELPAFNVWSPLLSLPRVMGTTVDTIPADVPYLHADPNLVTRWCGQLTVGRIANPSYGGDPGGRIGNPSYGNGSTVLIGIAWQGNPAHRRDRFRSIPLQEFAVLAAIPGVRLVSLQKGAGTEQFAAAPFPVQDLGPELDRDAGPFMDTAAVMRNLDLVVTADTCLAHVAGGLGVPVCVLLSRLPEWRWLHGRDDSPWYPTMRLYRQTRLGEWGPMLERLFDEIRGLLRLHPNSDTALSTAG